MGRKDICEKRLEEFPEVFADIFNVLLIKDEERYIAPDELESAPSESTYLTQDDIREQRRDVFKNYRHHGKRAGLFAASFGIENQTAVDGIMPVRIMSYDAAGYMEQLKEVGDRVGNLRRSNRKRAFIHPTITIVLNFSEQKWRTNTTLCDMMEIPENLSDLVPDYRIKVFDIAFLSDEVIERFTSDFKVVARFFKDKRLRRKSADQTVIRHVAEVLELLAHFTDTDLFEKMIPEMVERKEEGGRVTMCTFTQGLINEGIEQGRLEGGKAAIIAVVKRMLQANIAPDLICECTGVSREEVERLAEKLR